MGKKQKRNRAELYSLLLLAGGKSSRMGEDKAGLLLDGESFLSCQIKKRRSWESGRFMFPVMMPEAVSSGTKK